MKNTIIAVPLLSPEADSIIQAFIAEAPVADRTIISAMPQEREPRGISAEDLASNAELELTCPEVGWNPLSYASCRSAWQHAENLATDGIDELIIVVAPPEDADALMEIRPVQFENAVLACGSGLANFVQEAERRFRERGHGSIVIVLCAKEDAGLLHAMALGAATGFVEGILADQPQKKKASSPSVPEDSPVRFMSVRDESAQPDLLARYITKILDEPPRDAGKIMRHSGRLGIFGRS